jgi:hypothetical protein
MHKIYCTFRLYNGYEHMNIYENLGTRLYL